MRRLLATLGMAGLILAGTAGAASAAKPAPNDLAQRTCQKAGGTFLRVDGIIYVCLFPGGSTELLSVGSVVTNIPKSDRAGTLCVVSGGIYLRVDNLVYACVLPNSTIEAALALLPGLPPVPPLPGVPGVPGVPGLPGLPI